jgi:long-subunit acyl-CoA synthetase (AMP-forming)
LLGLIFKKVGAMLGGRMKLGVTGGGPVSADVQNFVRTAMHFNLVQGYGLTETCSNGTVQPALDVKDGIAGAPTASVQIRLNDCTDREPGSSSYKVRGGAGQAPKGGECRQTARSCVVLTSS